MKRLLKLGLAVLVLLVLALATVPFWIDGAARNALTREASAAAGVATDVDDVDIGIFGGSCEIANLTVANPDGFESPHFLALERGRIAVSLGSLMDDTVRASELVLDGIDLQLERRGDRANYRIIQKHLERALAGGGGSKGGKKFVIDRIVIKNLRVESRLSAIGMVRPPVRAGIAELRFDNVGDDGGQVLSAVIARITQAILGSLPQLGITLPAEIAKELTTDVGGLGLKIAGGIGKEIGKGIGGVVEGIGDLLDEDEKK